MEYNVIREEVANSACQHEEADTKMAFHINYIAGMSSNAHVVVRINDTDVLIFAHHIHQWNKNLKSGWMLD